MKMNLSGSDPSPRPSPPNGERVKKVTRDPTKERLCGMVKQSAAMLQRADSKNTGGGTRGPKEGKRKNAGEDTRVRAPDLAKVQMGESPVQGKLPTLKPRVTASP